MEWTEIPGFEDKLPHWRPLHVFVGDVEVCLEPMLDGNLQVYAFWIAAYDKDQQLLMPKIQIEGQPLPGEAVARLGVKLRDRLLGRPKP